MIKHKLAALAIAFLMVCNCLSSSYALSGLPYPMRTFYVSPNGTGNGETINTPSSIYQITAKVQPGDTVKLLGGTYYQSQAVILNISGTEQYPITWENYNGQTVVFDGIQRDVNISSPFSEKSVIQLEHCDWQILRGFTVRNSPSHGIGDFGYASNYNVYDNIISEDNYGNGIIVRGDYNTLTDCVARYNYDYAGDASTADEDGNPKPGDSGDGISPDGKHTKLIRCVSHHNSDDGYDCWFGEHGMFVNCVAFANGSNEGCRNRDHGQWETTWRFHGNGNGFKLGKGGDGPTCYQAFNTTIGCIAYDNLSGGFNTNQGGGNLCINCTAYNNNTSDDSEKDFNAFYSESNTGTRSNVFINNLALNTFPKPIKMNGPMITDHNSWNFWNQDTYALDVLLKDISAAEFVSVDFPDENASWADIKASGFLKLKADSICIDKGTSPKEVLERIIYTDKSIAAYDPNTDLGLEIEEILKEMDASLEFSGEGFDLGAFEVVPPPTVTAISVNTASATLEPGATLQVALVAELSDKSTKQITSEAQWVSANTNVASVDKGTITAVTPGRTTITASYKNKTAQVDVTVIQKEDPRVPTSMTSSVNKLKMKADQSSEIRIMAKYKGDKKPTDVTDACVWTSNNVEVATVNKGMVTCHSNGKAVITATLKGKTIKIAIDSSLKKLSASVRSVKSRPGQATKIVLTATMQDGSTREVTQEAVWQSANTGIATVDEGTVTCVGSGKTSILASYGGKSVKLYFDSSLKKLSAVPNRITGISPGSDAAIAVNAIYADGGSIDVTGDVQWRSSNPLVTIDGGKVHASADIKKKTTATLTAVYNSKKVTIRVTIMPGQD